MTDNGLAALEFPPTTVLAELARDEVRQRREEGCAVGDLGARVAAAVEDRDALWRLYRELTALKPAADFPYHEPDALDAIRAARALAPTAPQPPAADEAATADRIHGGWLGRCAGLVLGKPLESRPFIETRGATRRYLESADAFPLTDYVPNDPAALAAVGGERLPFPDSQRGNVRFVESDDDIRYTLMGLELLEQHGLEVTTGDVAAWWTHRLPSAFLFTAEEAALRNLFLLRGQYDPRNLSDEQLEQVRSWLNPYREWIGAQIRADGWALACPGRPTLAATLAWRDARLSHVKNGVYGEMFIAATIATALRRSNAREAIHGGRAQIPDRSRLAEAIDQVSAYCDAYDFERDDLGSAIEWLWDTFGAYHWVHTINNAAAVVLALLLGRGDFGRTIGLAVSVGWDADCNGATAGCIAGALCGAAQLPRHWIDPLNDTLRSALPDFHPIAISECAARHAALARAFADAQDPAN